MWKKYDREKKSQVYRTKENIYSTVAGRAVREIEAKRRGSPAVPKSPPRKYLSVKDMEETRKENATIVIQCNRQC